MRIPKEIRDKRAKATTTTPTSEQPHFTHTSVQNIQNANRQSNREKGAAGTGKLEHSPEHRSNHEIQHRWIRAHVVE
jgi:hypothetical protein